eukprot:3618597-Pyramimonas_sp.AAC.1
MPELDSFRQSYPNIHLGLVADDVQVLGIGTERELLKMGLGASHLLMSKLTFSACLPPSEKKSVLLATDPQLAQSIAAETPRLAGAV